MLLFRFLFIKKKQNDLQMINLDHTTIVWEKQSHFIFYSFSEGCWFSPIFSLALSQDHYVFSNWVKRFALFLRTPIMLPRCQLHPHINTLAARCRHCCGMYYSSLIPSSVFACLRSDRFRSSSSSVEQFLHGCHILSACTPPCVQNY